MSRYGGRAQSGEVAYSPERSRDIAERLWNQCTSFWFGKLIRSPWMQICCEGPGSCWWSWKGSLGEWYAGRSEACQDVSTVMDCDG